MKEERKLTSKEERIIRLCHHDFGGLTQKEAAVRMSISPSYVTKLLKSVRKKAPQLFPMISGFQAKVYKHLIREGLGYSDIAAKEGCSVKKITNTVYLLVKKGFNLRTGKTVRYHNWMDGSIIQKF